MLGREVGQVNESCGNRLGPRVPHCFVFYAKRGRYEFNLQRYKAPRAMVLRFPPLQRTQGWGHPESSASPNTQVWPPALCLKLLVLDAKASGTTAVTETVLANDSLSTLRDFASAWRDSAVSSRKRLNSASLVLSSPNKAEGSGFESNKTGNSRAGPVATHASRSDFAAITDPRNFPAGRCTGNPSSYSYRWTVRTAFPK